MTLSQEIRDLHRMVMLRSRAEAAETQREYEGYCEIYTLARFLSRGDFSNVWGFSLAAEQWDA